MHKPVVLIFLGPPGIGKGTQAVKVSEKLHLPHISTGDILRDNIKRKTPLGLKTEALIEKGAYVPDEIVSEMVESRTKMADCSKGFILDGYPRTLAQANYLAQYLGDDFSIKVINYFAEPDIIIERLCGRLTCKGCGKTYHKSFSPPKNLQHCDVCAGELAQRKDDQPDVVAKRLEVYNKETRPLIDFYIEKDLIHTIDCNLGIDEIFQKTLDVVKH